MVKQLRFIAVQPLASAQVTIAVQPGSAAQFVRSHEHHVHEHCTAPLQVGPKALPEAKHWATGQF
jgi:hypothetical protein